MIMVIVLVPITYASERLSITWLETDNKPFFVDKSEQYPLGGLCNNITDLLIEAMPNFKHQKSLLPPKRLSKYLDDGHLACYACMIHRDKKTNRATYSIPTAVYPSFSVLSTEERALKIKQKHGNPVSLISLFSTKMDINYFIVHFPTCLKLTPTDVNALTSRLELRNSTHHYGVLMSGFHKLFDRF